LPTIFCFLSFIAIEDMRPGRPTAETAVDNATCIIIAIFITQLPVFLWGEGPFELFSRWIKRGSAIVQQPNTK